MKEIKLSELGFDNGYIRECRKRRDKQLVKPKNVLNAVEKWSKNRSK